MRPGFESLGSILSQKERERGRRGRGRRRRRKRERGQTKIPKEIKDRRPTVPICREETFCTSVFPFTK